MAIPSFVSFKFVFYLFCFKFLCMMFCHVFLIFCHHLLSQGNKKSFNNSMKLTNFSWVKIHSEAYHIILEACFFPCIPTVISISSALINTISTRKRICFLFDFKVCYIFIYIRYFENFFKCTAIKNRLVWWMILFTGIVPLPSVLL